jgi:hypothetical protein
MFLSWRSKHQRLRKSSVAFFTLLSMLIYSFRLIYQPSIVADGNFKLDNVVMRKADQDVSLCNGRGFMVGSEAYDQHIASSVESKLVFNFEVK